MKMKDEWANEACEPCPHGIGYEYKYQCPFCLPIMFAACQRDAIEAAAKVLREVVTKETYKSEWIGMAASLAVDAEKQIRALLPDAAKGG